MAAFDPYQVLGVDPDADSATVRRAYQKLARRHHPDLAPDDPGAEERFERIQRAWHILGDPERRRRHDRGALERPPRGTAVRRGGAVTGGGRIGSEGFFEVRAEWREWIEEVAAPPGVPAPSADVSATLELELADAVRGTTTSLTVQRERPCDACAGAGEGCERCSGRGTVIELDRIRVRTPPGIADGARLRIPGKGNPVLGSPGGGDRSVAGPEERGDLFLTVSVRPHPYFRRRGLDVHAELPVTFAEAALGADVDVPTVDGPVRVRLPAGTQGGQRFRIRDRGITPPEGPPGDHHYTVRIVVPETLSEEQREAAEAFRGTDPRRELPERLDRD